jgi:tetratricopeptide (TPR) repeat protein
MRQLSLQRVLLLTLMASVAGCASAGKRFEQGTELEAQGQYAQASERYIQALRKDRGHVESRERLLEVGPQAIAEYVALAAAEGEAGNRTRAADQYLMSDALLSDAAAVGVALSVGEGYHTDRRSAMQAAVDRLLDDGLMAEERRNFADAMRGYDRADRYEPNGEQRSRLFDARVRTAVEWAEADLSARRHRAALAHADQAIALLGGPERPEAYRALELRAAALEQGTIVAAMAPLWRSDDAAQFLTDGFLPALNDELELHYWTEPPLFIASVDPVAVRRELRRERYNRSVLTPREAARVGRELEADYLVTGEIGIFTVTERDVRRQVEKVSTRSGRDTTYTIESGTVTYRVEITYLVMDVYRGREVRRSSVDVSESGDFERGVYSGNPSDLVLTRNARRYFDPERRRDVEQDLEERVIAKVSARLAEKVYRDVLRFVR